MKLSKPRFYQALLVLLLLAIFSSACSLFSGGAAPPATAVGGDVPTQTSGGGGDAMLTATLTELTGSVQVTSQSTGASALAFIGQQLIVGDRIMTGFDSRTRVDYANGTFFRIGPNSEAQITGIDTEAKDGFLANLKLNAGEIWIVLTGGELIVDTPSGVASVRGSYMSVSYDPLTGEMLITCLEGECFLNNSAGGVIMYAGQMAVISSTKSPVLRGLMRDIDFQWWLDNNPEASIILADVSATMQAYIGIGQFSDSISTPTPTPSSSEAVPFDAELCYVGAWNISPGSIQNYMIVVLTNSGLGSVSPVVSGSGTLVLTADGQVSANGNYSVNIASSVGGISGPFSLTGTGSASAQYTEANGKLNVTGVTKVIVGELTALGVTQQLDFAGLKSALNQLGFAADASLDKTVFNLPYTCNEQFMSITIREAEGVAITMERIIP